jgi:hypothetical protein
MILIAWRLPLIPHNPSNHKQMLPDVQASKPGVAPRGDRHDPSALGLKVKTKTTTTMDQVVVTAHDERQRRRCILPHPRRLPRRPRISLLPGPLSKSTRRRHHPIRPHPAGSI